MNTRQKATLYHELAKMLGAGLHLDRSIQILLEQTHNAPVKNYLEGLRAGLAENLSAAGAIGRHNKGKVTPLEIQLIEAGERGGKLDQAFEDLARYFELRQRARARAVGALIYPLIVLHMGLMLPDFNKLSAGGGFDSILRDGVVRVLVAWVVLGILGCLWLLAQEMGSTVPSVDRVLRTLPLVGGLRRHRALARFCQVMETGLLAALYVSESLRLAGNATGSAVLRSSAVRTAELIEAGGTLSGSMRAAEGFPRTFVNAVETAEESGTLDVEMKRWAKVEVELASAAQDRVTEWLPRIFYVGVMIYVAYRILSMAFGVYGPGGTYRSIIDAAE